MLRDQMVELASFGHTARKVRLSTVAREGEQEKLARQDAPALGLYVVTLRYQATSTG